MIALAALVIDVSALFTARGDAKQAADAAALAGAKVLANSGMTSDPTNATLQANAVALATQVATAVATKNTVGGRPLTTGEITVSFNTGALTFATNPQITVTARRTDLPTFFARAWGTRIVPVGATAVAEDVMGAATEEARRQGLTVEGAKSAVGDVSAKVGRVVDAAGKSISERATSTKSS